MLWAPSLLLGSGSRVRLLGDLLLLLGGTLSAVGWWIIGDAVAVVIALACLAVTAIHLMSVIVCIWSNGEATSANDQEMLSGPTPSGAR